MNDGVERAKAPRLARIGTRLGVAFGLMGVLMLGLGAFSAARLQSVSAEFVDVLDTRLPRLELMQSVLDDLNGLNIAARDAIGASADEMTPLIARIDKAREQVGSKVQQLQDAFKDDGELGAKTAEEFAGHGSGVLVSLVKFARALRAQNAEAATRTLRESIQPRLNGMMTAVESYRGGQLAALQDGKKKVDATMRSALVAIAALVGVSLVVAGVAEPADRALDHAAAERCGRGRPGDRRRGPAGASGHGRAPRGRHGDDGAARHRRADRRGGPQHPRRGGAHRRVGARHRRRQPAPVLQQRRAVGAAAGLGVGDGRDPGDGRVQRGRRAPGGRPRPRGVRAREATASARSTRCARACASSPTRRARSPRSSA
jgi:methyl-accepting chemotaxis protein